MRSATTIVDEWGGPVGIEERAPSKAADPAFREWWASYLRMGASPGAAVALTRMNAEIDIRDVLPSIRVPTLVLHRTRRSLPEGRGRTLSRVAAFPAPTFVELPGDDHLPFVGDQDEILVRDRAVPVARPRADRTRARAGHGADGRVRRGPGRRRASAPRVRARGGVVSRPDRRRGRPSRSWRRSTVPAARSSAAAPWPPWLSARGSRVRAGVHIGECEPSEPRRPDHRDQRGTSPPRQRPGEVLVSRTVVDLVPGSGLQFADRGALRLPGLQRDLPVLAASRC